jgi:proline iminopeptidase
MAAPDSGTRSAPIAAMLWDLGPVVRWDQRGGGRSQWQGPYSIARFVADLDQVRAQHGFDSVTLVGHSWGAALSLAYAWEHPERVSKLIYIAGFGLGQGWRDQHRANFLLASRPYAVRITELEAVHARTPDQERELQTLRLAPDFPDGARALELAATQTAEIFDEDKPMYQALIAEIRQWNEAELVDRCKALDVPTLIIDGERDLRPRSSVDSLEQALPTVSRVRLERAGHLPWLDDPAQFEQALRRFV